jgi:hypothetical protein
MHQLRKLLIILLVSCFILQTGGLLLVMYLRQMELKREMKARLRADPDQPGQIVLEFDLANGKPIAPSFEWEEEGQEFRFNGSIYDVLEKKLTGDKLYLRCIDDKNEAAVIKMLDELHKKDATRDQPFSSPVHQLLTLLLFHQDNSPEFLYLTASIPLTDRYNAFVKKVIIDILAPPPRSHSSFYC